MRSPNHHRSIIFFLLNAFYISKVLYKIGDIFRQSIYSRDNAVAILNLFKDVFISLNKFGKHSNEGLV